MPIDLRLDADEWPLLTDLYQLTMAASYFEHGYNDLACFSLTTRRMPPDRGFLIAAGVERVIEALEQFHFDAGALDYLDSLKLFKAEFLDSLSRLRFSGELWAMPEGSLFFAQEPVLEICAPLIEAQLIETVVLNQVGMASLVASKAARAVLVAGGRRLVDFGPRRAQGADAALIAARSSYLAGFIGSSNLLAGKRYGIPVYGTMSHSYVMAHDSEREAFEHFVDSFPQLSTLLVDTYSTPRGVEIAAEIGRRLRQSGVKLQGIRLDSGDLAALSRQARRLLDQAGLGEVSIFASGNLDEYAIAELVKAGAPIDAFGVGTAMVVSADAPALDVTYKLVEYKGIARLKTSVAKLSTPGRKQVFRARDAAGHFSADIIGLLDESPATIGREFRRPLSELQAVLALQMRQGRRVTPRPSLAQSREYCLQGLGRLDQRFKALRKPDSYEVRLSAALRALEISEKVRAESRQA